MTSNDSAAASADAGRPDEGAGPDWSAPQRFALILAAMIFIPFWNVLLGFETFGLRDFGVFSLPTAYFQRECFWHGQLPLWNPYNCCGVPFLAQFNTLALYPLSLIYLLLPLTWALPVFCLFHLFLGGLGMYFLASRWTGSRPGGALAGVAFAFNGVSLNVLMWPSHIATFAWMPWVILLVEKAWREGGRNIVLAALAAGMEVLAGGPETILFTWLVLLAVAVVQCCRQPARTWTTAQRFLSMGCLALGLAAAQILPFVDFALHSSRKSNFAGSEWSMPPWGWGNFLVPLFQTSKWQQIAVQRDQYWTSSYYAGIGVLFLAVLALWRRRHWRVWLLGGFLLASLVLALGNNGFVFGPLKRLLPFLGMFRYPVKFVILTLLTMPLLAAYAVADYQSAPPGERRRWGADILVGAVMLALIGVILWVARFWPVENTSWPATAANALSRTIFLLLTFLAVILFYRRPPAQSWSIVLLLAVCWGDLTTHMPWQNPTMDPALFQPGFGKADAKFDPEPNIAHSRLMMSPFSARQLYYKPAADMKTNYVLDRVVFLADCNLLDGLPKVDGFFSLALRESDRVLWLLDPSIGRQLDSLEDLLSVSHTIAPGKVFDWVSRTNYIPIVTAGQEPLFAGDQAVFDAIANIQIDFRKFTCLPPRAKAVVKARRQPDARILSTDFSPTRQKIQVTTPGPALVVLSQAYYHNWTASVDGAPAPLWRANYAFQAVEVPEGKHDVLLTYKDKALRMGGIISLVSALVCVGGWMFLPGAAGRETAN
ncbi:MAG: YfhO family protein [Verrucomicrobiota bacterium]